MINKIGFIGTGGTGKTTTLGLLDTDLPRMKSASRIIFEREGLKEEDQSGWSEQQKWEFQKRIFDEKIRQDSTTERFIADRTLLDHFVYCLYRCHRSLSTSVIESLEVLVEENLRAYDLLFYFPVGLFEAPPDGLRDTNPGYRFVIATLIEGMLFKLGVPCWWVPSGTPEERAKFVQNRIQVGETGRAHLILGNRSPFRR